MTSAMTPAVFTAEQKEIINANPVVVFRLPGVDAMDYLKTFLLTLSYSKPARLITLANSLDNLAIELRRFVYAWEEEEVTLPKRLRPQLSELDIWTTVVTFLKESNRLVESLKKDWTSIFIPDSLNSPNRSLNWSNTNILIMSRSASMEL